MSSELVSVEHAAELINSGARLLIAGDEALLRRLPAGEWIGGTTPYFMAGEGGVATQQRVMVTSLPDEVVSARIVAGLLRALEAAAAGDAAALRRALQTLDTP